MNLLLKGIMVPKSQSLYSLIKASLLDKDLEKLLEILNQDSAAVSLLKSTKFFKDTLKAYYFPKLNDLGSNPLITIQNSKEWTYVLFDIFNKEIQDFISLKDRVESLIISERLDDALSLIDSIESNFGSSIWILDKRIIIEVTMMGNKASETSFSQMISDSNINELLRIIISIILDRAETRKASFSSIERMVKLLKDQFGPHYGAIMTYYYSKQSLTIDDLRINFQVCSKFSLIDYYESFVFFASKDLKIISNDAKIYLNKNIIFNDYRLKHLKKNPVLNLTNLDISLLETVEKYTKGLYDELIDSCLKKDVSKDVDYLFLLGKGITRGNCSLKGISFESFIGKILNNISDLINKNGTDSNLAYDSLVGVFTMLNSFSLSDYIVEFLSSHVYIRAELLAGIQMRKRYLSFRDFDRGVLSQRYYREQVASKYRSFLTLKLFHVKWDGRFEGLQGASLEMPQYRFLLNKASYLMTIREFSRVQEIIKQLDSINLHPLDKIKKDKIVFDCLRSVEDYRGLFIFLQNLYLDNVYSYYFVDYKSLLDEIYRGAISFDKCCSDYLKFLLSVNSFDPGFRFVLIKQSLRFFCREIGASTIEDVFKVLVKNDRDVISFHMILNGGLLAFTGLVKAGVKIFDLKMKGFLLLKEYTKDEDYYDGIVKELIEETVLESDIKKYDKEKIYVDINSILGAYNFLDGFEVIMENKSQKPFVLKAPDGQELFFDSMLPHLNDIVRVVLNDYTSNSKFGLATSLSLGITHGVLENYMKSIIGESKLLMIFDPVSEVSKIDDYWLTKDLYYEDKVDVEVVEASLAIFNRNISSLIRNFIKERLSIVVDKSDGEFIAMGTCYDHTNYFVEVVRSTENLDYNSFLKMLADYFDARLDSELAKVRSYLKGDLQERLLSYLRDLSNSLDGVTNKESVLGIKAMVRDVETRLVDALNKIDGWFYRRVGVSPWVESRNLRNIIQIAKTYHEKFINLSKEVNATLDGDVEIKVLPQYTTHFIDIFYNLIQNTITYSCLLESDISFRVSVQKVGEFYFFEYINSVKGSSDSLNEKKERLLQVLRSINDGSYLERVAGDFRGTGIPKVEKILRFDIGESGIKDISLLNDEFCLVFFVKEDRFGD